MYIELIYVYQLRPLNYYLSIRLLYYIQASSVVVVAFLALVLIVPILTSFALLAFPFNMTFSVALVL